MSTNPLSIAIVGCGMIGLNHARAIARLPGLLVVAAVDSYAESANELAELWQREHGGNRPGVFDTLTQALDELSVDIVVICTPSGLHVQLAEVALSAGAHVVIEKPLDVSLPRARRIADLAQQAEARGQLVSVICQHRFDPASQLVAEAVHSGEFGRLTSCVASVAWWRSQDYYDSGQWRGTWELDGGGALMNQGVHTVDLMLWFMGKPIEVVAQTALLAHERVAIEDIAVATIRFESGALAVLHATTAAYPELSVRIQVHGSAGSAVIDDDQLAFFASAPKDGQYDASGKSVRDRSAELLPAEQVYGNEKEADAFVIGHMRQYIDIESAIREGHLPGVRVQDAVLALAVVRSVYLSATLGESISVDDVLSGRYDEVSVVTGGDPVDGDLVLPVVVNS